MRKRDRGSTLIELMVSIGIIGVIISIALPSLMRARSAAGQAASLANVRDIAATIELYCQANTGRYPAVRHGVQYSLSLDGSGARWSSTDEAAARWQTRHRWWFLVRTIAPADENWQVWTSPGAEAPSRSHFQPHYYFSNSFVAAPVLWSERFNPDLHVLRDVRQHEVRAPSQKAIIWDAVMAYLYRTQTPREGPAAQPMPVAFADGHGEVRRYSEAAPAYPNPLSADAWRTTRLHNTPEGVEGRDF
ncbi:MAG: prepilin-type N-terminal cleavage/methylation domain-containing protein [Phycisphaeraceae bacterium]|nr:MAG: prepilin-type N-terminal cleavage/methylation domain-containing protein [Phycisphaeraceae bacterium]